MRTAYPVNLKPIPCEGTKLSAVMVCLAVAFALSGCSKSKRVTSQISTVTAAHWHPHGSYNNELIVDKHRFEWVRGSEPYYVEVPELKSILFLCDNRDYSVTIHLYNLAENTDRKVHADSVLFGMGIGLPNGGDSVKVIDKDRIELIDENKDSIATTRVNLGTGKVEFDHYKELNPTPEIQDSSLNKQSPAPSVPEPHAKP
ncbi:MAG: hypothetical protein JWO08_11 [Verrucomicrobiaceae bacterium]|nr:hypothetical protein [Verrucomicrobiaceae bacterium]